MEPQEQKVSSSQEDVELLKIMFDYQREQHQGLLGIISDTRNVCNYVITGILAFTGFILTSNNSLLGNEFQKIVFYALLALSVGFWIRINWSLKVTGGFRPRDLLSLLANPKQDRTEIYKLFLESAGAEYDKASKKLTKKIELNKRIFLVVSIIFFIVAIILINFPNLNLSLHV